MSVAKKLAPQFQAELMGASSVLIGTHLNPDGDALGSALALSHLLDGMGIYNEVLNHHLPPANLEFLPGVGRVRQEPKREKFDLCVVLDLDSTERLGNVEPFFGACTRLIVVDHHIPHEAPGDLRIVDTDASATAAILTEMLLEMGAAITPDIATCLLTGIVTDTGSFRFRNTTVEALTLAARLLELGGDINLVSEEIFQRKPLSSARLLGFMLERMVLEADDRIAYSVLDFNDFEVTGARDENTEGFVNELLSIRTVQIAALIREPKPGRIRVSLRSRGEFDIAEVARQFGGGGHKNAAGCAFDGNPEDAVTGLVPRLRACLESS
ncbi:MAG: bifunctional oligoribonuclease/PAP phosphatase NrnA [Fimbriimonadaceae bacterium]|nr:bifunctional oligoribonuclease/PAP phosphatase NrnA [Chthonomonadaceae bacterium]MCO5297329.1 bifunctional oligoribonuclease/PAP phosphatase NrnA [Fimbriimonadaceae bacterium]